MSTQLSLDINRPSYIRTPIEIFICLRFKSHFCEPSLSRFMHAVEKARTIMSECVKSSSNMLKIMLIPIISKSVPCNVGLWRLQLYWPLNYQRIIEYSYTYIFESARYSTVIREYQPPKKNVQKLSIKLTLTRLRY